MTVTVYSKPNCQPCKATKRALKNQKTEFVEVDITQDEKALEYVMSLGHQAAPVVVVGETNWSGFKPDRIAALASSDWN